MAKSDGLLNSRPNTIEENERVLQELQDKYQAEDSEEDLPKLFIKLNRKNEVKLSKDTDSQNLRYNKNVVKHLYGPIPGFPPGAWWGIRMDCSRDGVHEPFDTDIHDGPAGVTSICTSNTGETEDIDLGDFLTISGEPYVEGDSNKDPLIKNYKNQVPVRLIRSYNLLNCFAPKTGYRYDGLYFVSSYWIGINMDNTKNHKFALRRIINQEPSPWCMEEKSEIKELHCPKPNSSDNTHGACGTYKLRKCTRNSDSSCSTRKSGLHKDSASLTDTEGTKAMKCQKSVSESVIVTRHVFKKTSNSVKNVISPSTSSASDPKTLSLLDGQKSKAQSTNISIRTGLYDSSHSVQQDAKKGALMTFCRSFKPSNISKHVVLNIENSNLLNKDINKSDDKMEALKNQNKSEQTESALSCSSRMSTLSKQYQIYPPFTTSATEPVTNGNTNVTSLEGAYSAEHSYAICLPKHDCEENATAEPKENLKHVQDYPDSPTKKLKYDNSQNSSMGKSDDQGSQTLESLDSLTPDKILNLINREKYHPLSKLLIGNMIGLTSEESVILRGYDKLMSEIRNKDIAQAKKAEDSSSANGGSYKYRRCKTFSRKIGRYPSDGSPEDIGDKGPRNDMKDKYLRVPVIDQNNAEDNDERLSSGDEEGEASSSGKQKNVSEDEIRTRLEAIEDIGSGKQHFTKGSVKKHIHKKRRREIANLLIDAKIGPKVRGPRNRRLRCINDVNTKDQCYDSFNPIIYPTNKRKMGMRKRGRKPAFKRRGKLGKLTGHHQRLRERQGRKIGYKRASKLNTRSNENHNIPPVRRGRPPMKTRHSTEKLSNNNTDNNNRRSNRSTRASMRNFEPSRSPLNRTQKNLVQTISTCRTVTRKCLKCYHDKEVKKPSTTDAVTQCTLISEAPIENSRDGRQTRNDNDLDGSNFQNEQSSVKVEYSDVEEIKCESMEDEAIDEENCEDYRPYDMYPPTDTYNDRYAECYVEYSDNSSPRFNGDSSSREEYDQREQRISAFVPVNTVDNDLRIARLRSIGFKPITPQSLDAIDEETSTVNQGRSENPKTQASKVTKRDVAEEYNKYTNEENNVVLYMDEELQYQDIEDEDEIPAKRCMTSYVKKSNGKQKAHGELPLEQDLESPWHGWKKIVTNEESYWIGW